jgi:hypothetical protein
MKMLPWLVQHTMFGVWEWVKTNGNESLRKLVNLIPYKGLLLFFGIFKKPLMKCCASLWFRNF